MKTIWTLACVFKTIITMIKFVVKSGDQGAETLSTVVADLKRGSSESTQ